MGTDEALQGNETPWGRVKEMVLGEASRRRCTCAGCVTDFIFNRLRGLYTNPSECQRAEGEVRADLEAAMLEISRLEEEYKAERQRNEPVITALARELLREYLTDEQWTEFEQFKHFHVQVGDRRYRIERERIENVYRVNERSEGEYVYCLHPWDELPLENQMLTQKLMLETDEEEFLDTAIASYLF